jgi:uncharacterized protein YdhG (YjbR/CyaY superfamily)
MKKKAHAIPKDIDDYIARFPRDVREILENIRVTIKTAVPGAEEKISYQMPAFALKGNLVYFAVWKKHIGFYPTSSGTEKFKKELSVYKGAKGSVQFPLDEPIPYALIGRIVKFRAQENAARGASKSKSKARSKTKRTATRKSS